MEKINQIELIPGTLEHARLWMSWRQEPNTIRYNPLANSSESELLERFSKAISDLSQLNASSEVRLFVRWQNQVVGNVSLKNVNLTMQYAEIGYGVGQDFQGKGLGTESVKLFVEKIFRGTSLRKLIAYVAEDNLPSCRLLEKIGFRKEGVLREHYIINEKPTNEVLYGLLRSDWSAW